MPVIAVHLLDQGQGDVPWPELVPRFIAGNAVHYTDDAVWSVAVIEAGMDSGAPSVALRLDLTHPDEETITLVAETSLAAWAAVTVAARARYPQAFAGGPLERRPVGAPDETLGAIRELCRRAMGTDTGTDLAQLAGAVLVLLDGERGAG